VTVQVPERADIAHEIQSHTQSPFRTLDAEVQAAFATNMEFIHPEIDREYQRWVALIGPDDPYTSRITVGLHDIMRAHFLIADYFLENKYGIGGVGPKSMNLLHSAIYRQFVGFGGKEKWPDSFDKLATLLFGLVKDHPFHDANKRTALLTALYQLDRLNRTPKIPQRDFEDFVVDIADNRLAKHARYRQLTEKEEDGEILFISDFLRRSSRVIETREFTITYHQLNSRLKGFGFELVNVSGNNINVVKYEDHRKYLGIVGPVIQRPRRICQIGFPGWKKQVPRGALKEVRDKTKLTELWGVDSAVFYQGADPLHSLIDIYAEPLRRLANR